MQLTHSIITHVDSIATHTPTSTKHYSTHIITSQHYSIHVSPHSTSHPLQFIALLPCNYCTSRHLITHYNPLQSCQNAHTHTSSYFTWLVGTSRQHARFPSRPESKSATLQPKTRRNALGVPHAISTTEHPLHATHVLVEPLFSSRSPRPAAQFDITRP